ncbi:MAG: hypothetical protein IJD85_05060 [Oscillospiraceae bacterium]|nr:hypothetical protein [Oscillospiraceae bacterium]
MAQRLVHYLFGEMLSQQAEIKDKSRFLLGSVMPDAYTDVRDRNKTHFKRRLTSGMMYFDFDSFKAQFHSEMLCDELYLGYYMHLVEDAFYRTFIHGNGYKMPNGSDEIARLHNDYHILNAYIVKKYNITNILNTPVNIGCEPIQKIADFRLSGFVDDMSNDFTEQTSGNTCFVTESMLDRFIAEYSDRCITELQSVLRGETYLAAEQLAYSR